MSYVCSIVPEDVLKRLAEDSKLSAEIREASAHTGRISVEIRKLQKQAVKLTAVANSGALPLAELAAAPMVTIYDCKHAQTVPGTPVPNPGRSSDSTAKHAFEETTGVADFYRKVFNQNSIDNAGMTAGKGDATLY